MRRIADQHGWVQDEDEFEINIAFDRDPDFEDLQQGFDNDIATTEEATKSLRKTSSAPRNSLNTLTRCDRTEGTNNSSN